MIKSVNLGEELVITTKNKVGIMADIATMLANQGVNIEAVAAYESGKSAKLLLVTNANIRIVGELRKKGYKSLKETEVIMVELEDKPGALKVVTTELKKRRIDIKYLYVTSSYLGGSSRLVMQTSDNEKAIALLTKYLEKNSAS